jgi:methionine-rich copper-binding protein CopC
MKRLLLPLLVGLMITLGIPLQAAHAAGVIVVSDPEEHAELTRAPGWVSMVFTTEVDPELAKLVVLNSAGENVTVDAIIVEGTQITTQLRSGLPKGTYTVLYRVGDSKGEPVGGSYQFAYGKGDWSPDAKSTWKGEANQPPVIADPNPNPTGVATGAPTTSATPSVEPTASSTDTAAPQPTGTATPAPAPATGGSDLWLWGGLLVAILVVAAGSFLLIRRRNGASRAL